MSRLSLSRWPAPRAASRVLGTASGRNFLPCILPVCGFTPERRHTRRGPGNDLPACPAHDELCGAVPPERRLAPPTGHRTDREITEGEQQCQAGLGFRIEVVAEESR